MAIILACWRWLTAPARAWPSPPARLSLALHAPPARSLQFDLAGAPPLALIHVPLPRLLS